MSDTTFRILIDSSGAEAGAARVRQSLLDIEAQAARTVKSIQAMQSGMRFGPGMQQSVSGVESSLRGIQREAARAAVGARDIESGFSRLGSSARSTDGIRRGLMDVQSEARRVVASTRDMENGFDRMTSAATSLKGVLAAVGISAGFQELYTTLATFDTSMSRAQAATGATGEDLAKLEAMARKLGSTMAYSASETLDAMSGLALAGQETNEVLASIPAVIDMATAGEMKLADAVKITTGTLSIFKLEADKASLVGDTLAKAAAISSTSITGIGHALSYVGPIAAAFGTDMQTLSASIAVLSNNGLDAERAGTGLRRVLSELNNPTKAAKDELAQLGLTAADISPSTNSFIQIIEKLTTSGLDASRAFKIFGDEGTPAILNLVRNIDQLKEFDKTVRDAGGSAAKTAAIMNDNLAADFSTMINVAKELTFQLGDAGVTGGLRLLIQSATGVMRVWGGQTEILGESAAKYQELAETIEQLAVIIGTVYIARALGPMIAQTAMAVRAKGTLVVATMAAQRAAATEAASAAAAATASMTVARANLAAAQAAMGMAVAMDRGTGSMVNQRNAAITLKAAHDAVAAAQARVTATGATMNAALTATTLRARAATVAMRGLSTAMAFFGGPIGFAITAIAGGIYLLSQRTDEAAKSQEVFNGRMDRMVQISAELSTASGQRRADLEAERQQLVKNTQAELDHAEAQLLSLEKFKEAGNMSWADIGVKAFESYTGANLNTALKKIGEVTGIDTSKALIPTTDQQIEDKSAFVSTKRTQIAKLREAGGLPAEGEAPAKTETPPPEGGFRMGITRYNAAPPGTPGRKPEPPVKVKPVATTKPERSERPERNYDSGPSDAERMIESLAFEEEQLKRNALMRRVYENLRRADIDTTRLQAASYQELLPQLSGEGEQIANLTRVLFEAETAENAREEAIRRGLEASRERSQQEERQKELVQDTLNGLIEEERYYRQLTETVGMSSREFEIETQLMDLRNRLLSEGIVLTAEQERQIRSLISATYDHQNGMNGARLALSEYARSLELTEEVMAQGAIRGLGHLEDALVDIVMGSKSAKEAVADMAKAIAADFARMAIRAAIIRPLMMGFGFATGGIMTDTGPAMGGDAFAKGGVMTSRGARIGGEAFATGGIMTAQGRVPLNTYAGGGIANSPQIAVFGEGRQSEAYVPLPDGKNIPVKMQVNDGGGVKSSAPSGSTFVANVNVTPPQGGNQQDAERFGAVISRQMESAFTDMLQRQQRPGGLLNPNGGY